MKQRHDGLHEAEKVNKRCVEYAIFQKWWPDLDRKYQTMSWLGCIFEKEGTRKVVAKLKCQVCSKFVNKIQYRKNFSQKWIVGADSVSISKRIREKLQVKFDIAYFIGIENLP